MTTNHGIYRKLPETPGALRTGAQAPVFRYGIWRVFQALTAESAFTADQRIQANALHLHFGEVAHRFVFSMQDLNQLMQEFATAMSDQGIPMNESMRIQLQAACLADHVLTYLSTILDDVAILIVRITGFPKPVDSMGGLRGASQAPELSPLKHLLDELGVAGSWWELGFAPKRGARQLLIHNQHIVQFQVSQAPGRAMEADAYLMSPVVPGDLRFVDFFDLLRKLLSSLFNWFDALEDVLIKQLRILSPAYSPKAECPGILLPVGYPSGTTRFDSAYFPIPLCDNSDPLPWTVSVQAGPGAIEVMNSRK